MTFDGHKFKSAQKAAWTNVAEQWHTGLAPSLIPVSKKLIAFVGIPNGSEVLDLACGDGSLALEAAKAGAAQVIAADHATTFGAIIERRAEQEKLKGHVHFQEADIEELPFREKQFDVILCQFGLMFAPHRKKAFQEIYRVLKPQGSFAAAVWSRPELNVPCAGLLGILNEYLPPRPEGTPSLFELGTPKLIETELQSVGFREYKEILMDVNFQHKNIEDAWSAWKHNGPFEAAYSQLDKKNQKDLEKKVRKFLSEYKTRSKTIELPASALLFCAKRGFETLTL